MSSARTKIDIIYEDVLGDVDRLVTQVEGLQSVVPTHAEALRTEANRLSETLAAFSAISPAARSRAGIIAAAATGGAIVLATMAVAVAVGASKGAWIAGPNEKMVTEAVSASGVDLSEVTTTELRVRLSIPAADTRRLMAALAVGTPDEENHVKIINEIVQWLRTVPGERQQAAFEALITAVSQARKSPAKSAIIAMVVGISDADANALAEALSAPRVDFHGIAGTFLCRSAGGRR
jgi:hypothetical protein